jgi:hypothetical protein
MNKRPKKRQGPIGALLDPTDLARDLRRYRSLVRATMLLLVVVLVMLPLLCIWMLRLVDDAASARLHHNSPARPALQRDSQQTVPR